MAGTGGFGNYEGKFSGFNEAAFQMQRINELQQLINLTNLNLLAYDTEKLQYNYEIKFNAINSLFIEASSKCSSKEIKEAMQKRKLILLLLEIKPPFPSVNDPRIPKTRKRKMFRKENFDELKEYLFEYELFVRTLLESHKMTSPSGDRPEEAAFK